MTTQRDTTAPSADTRSPAAHQAFLLLRTVFTVAPILFGLDKFVGLLTDWEQYLAPQIDNLIPGTAHQAMLAVGVVEIIAGLLVAVLPRIGGYVVAAWLAGIIVNLLLIGGYYDVALRDFGLLVAALALARLAPPGHPVRAHACPGAGRRTHDRARPDPVRAGHAAARGTPARGDRPGRCGTRRRRLPRARSGSPPTPRPRPTPRPGWPGPTPRCSAPARST